MRGIRQKTLFDENSSLSAEKPERKPRSAQKRCRVDTATKTKTLGKTLIVVVYRQRRGWLQLIF